MMLQSKIRSEPGRPIREGKNLKMTFVSSGAKEAKSEQRVDKLGLTMRITTIYCCLR